MSIVSHPTEILWAIFLHLPGYESVLNCRVVCRAFRSAIDASVELQYQIKLRVWGYEDSVNLSYSHFSIAKRLEQLEQHVKSWSSLDWEETRLRLPRFDCQAFAPGVYVGLTVIDDDDWDKAATDLISIKLPSRLRGTDHLFHRTRLDVVNIFDVAVDPAQDLLVLVQLAEPNPDAGENPDADTTWIHFRRISEPNVPHSGAFRPWLVTGSTLLNDHKHRVVIHHDLVAFWDVDMYNHERGLSIYNWRSGDHHWHINAFVDSCIFLNSRTIAITHPKQYHERMRVVKLVGDAQIEDVAILELPTNTKDYSVYLKQQAARASDAQLPFYPSNEGAFVSLEFTETLEPSSSIVLNADAIRPNYDYPPGTSIPYFIWSAGQTIHVIRDAPNPRRYNSGLYGGRHVLLQPRRDVVVLSDFVMSRGRSGVDYQLGHIVDYDTPLYIGPDDEVYRDLLHQSKPYYRVKRQLGSSPLRMGSTVFMDDESIVLIQEQNSYDTEFDLVVLTF